MIDAVLALFLLVLFLHPMTKPSFHLSYYDFARRASSACYLIAQEKFGMKELKELGLNGVLVDGNVMGRLTGRKEECRAIIGERVVKVEVYG